MSAPTMPPAPVHLVLDRGHEEGPGDDPCWAGYAEEILGHLRIPWSPVRDSQLGRRVEPGVLVFPTPPRLSPGEVADVTDWVAGGGTVLLCGGPGSLDGLAGVVPLEEVAEAHVHAGPAPLWGDEPGPPLHAFGGVRLRVLQASAVAWWGPDRAERDVAVSVRRLGAGRCVVLGVDVWQSVVRLQQGWPIFADGEPAPDGSAPVDDGILKSDDGISLSYTLDRDLPGQTYDRHQVFRHGYPATERPAFFDRAQADRWRVVLTRTLWWLATEAGHAVPWLHYWPAGCEAVAHLSHDTDGNRDADALAALDVFAQAGLRTTWCFLFPGGLSPETVARVVADGHEVALHFNALDDGCDWTVGQLRTQLTWLRQLAGREDIVTNKNHFLRWEGWDEFFVWCEELGIQIDQSHGPSKQGNVGFPFGSCHLAFPLSGEGRVIDVLALPLQCQDLWWTTPSANRELMVDEVVRVHGVFHCLFHGPNIAEHDGVHQAVLDTVAAVRRRGLPWWTSAELNRWERARRGVDVGIERVGSGWRIVVHSRAAMTRAGVMVVLPECADGDRWSLTSGAGEARSVRRHGLLQLEIAADLPVGTSTFVVEPQRGAAVAAVSGRQERGER